MADSIDIQGKLRNRYSGSEWAIAFEVPNSTGGGSRRCDCMAMHLWSSKGGYSLHGHEIKKSRSDWLREIDDPSKAEEFARRCHYWWIVAPKGIVKLEELPTNWGLMHCSEKSSLRVASAAQKNRKPVPIDWPFFAACMRAFSEQSDIEAKMRAAYGRGIRESHQAVEDSRKAVREAVNVAVKGVDDRWKHSIADFEKQSGIEIGAYDGGRIGQAVKLARRILCHRSIVRIVSEAKEATKVLESLETLVGEVVSDD